MSSDEASFGVTYTSISSDYEEPSDAGSPGVVIYGYDGLPMQPIPVEDQPHAADASPTALSPGCIANSDPEEDLGDKLKDGPMDYLADEGDDDDDFSGDDANDEEEEEASEEDKEEHLALADFIDVSPAVDLVPSAEETKPFETDESVATPPPPLTYRTTSRIFKRLYLPLGPRFKVGESSSSVARPAGGYKADYWFIGTLDAKLRHDRVREIGYGITDVWEDPAEATEEVPPTTIAELSQRVTDLVTTIRHEIDGINVRFEDAQYDRALLSGQVNMLRKDRQYYLHTSMLVESEARVAREAWEQSMGCSRVVHDELQAYQTHTQIQDTRIFLLEALVTTLVSQTTSLWTQLIAALGRIDTLEAREPAHIDAQRMLIAIKMPLRKGTRTRTTPATATATTTTLMTDAAIRALMARGVADALAERTIQKNTNLNGDGSQGSRSGITRPVRPTCECTYNDFLKCQPLKFKGTEGVVGLTQWFERMESVFHISNCVVENQVNFATCTLHGIALTWWNTHVKTVGHDAAYGMPWKRLTKLMTAKYCPQNEIKKLEIVIRNLKYDKVEKYVSGLPDMIQGSVMAYKPKEMQDAIEFATELIDQKIRTLAERQIENKRKQDDNFRDNQNQQQSNKRQNTSKAYTARPMPQVQQGWPPGLRLQEFWQDNASNNQRATRANQKGENGNALAKVYVVGNAGTNPDSDVAIGTFLLNNRYAFILFDTSADRSFVSSAFSSLIDITPTTLDHYYDVELADGKIIRINIIIQGCTLNFLNHLFNIDLMPVELGSFNVIIGMDWLVKYHAIIVCDEKLVRIPFGNETLTVHGLLLMFLIRPWTPLMVRKKELRLGAGLYDSWKLQGDVKELWDELSKLGLGLRCCFALVVPRLRKEEKGGDKATWGPNIDFRCLFKMGKNEEMGHGLETSSVLGFLGLN
ncbi:putative reverse transcriptase domain-containing protein [Tanacetum coccineum]|uniref:Reverse transcriptase domain-containing protein n=1 Tax=Tanacetum coccineum TaxID=301880 RepID=A0ABQ5EXA4_9ASTR